MDLLYIQGSVSSLKSNDNYIYTDHCFLYFIEIDPMSIYVTASIVMAVVAIVYAIYLAMNVLKQPAGNEKMQMISNAIAE